MSTGTARGLLTGAALLWMAGCQPGDVATDEEPAPEEPADREEPAPEEPADPAEDPAEPEESQEADPPAADEAPEVSVEEVATHLDVPWDVAFVDDRAYVSERDTGRVLELLDDGGTAEVASFDVDASGEGGLLGLTADEDGRLYAYFSAGGENRVERFRPGGQDTETVLDGIPHHRNHNGGRLSFGPDGLLYVSTGDAGDGQRAQDPESLAGKILRLTAEGDIPDDNPEEDSAVYALGLRNVQGLDWDDEGRLWASEFGPDVDDEINVIEPGGNYGWPEVTGEAGVEDFVDPVLVAQPPEASWTGLTVLSDGALDQWDGDVFVAALRGERVWRLEAEDGAVTGTEELLVEEHGRLRHVAQAPDGALWVLTSNTDGRGDPAGDDDRILRLGPEG